VLSTNRKTNRPKRRLQLEALEDRTAPAVLTVTSLADNTTDTTVMTLRAAVDLVDSGGASVAARGAPTVAPTGAQTVFSGSFGSGDTIQFDPGLFSGGPQTLSMSEGLMLISKSVTVNGPGAGLLTIDAQGQSQIFRVGQLSPSLVFVTGPVALDGLTLTGGYNNLSGSSGAGGAIFAFMSPASGGLTLNDCTFTGNSSAQGQGGR
jgi:hypothetical protein